ncbi:MAG TPA: TetR/AcrR family transcriptional regulator, partial [Burkholderiaceae bacterium]
MALRKNTALTAHIVDTAGRLFYSEGTRAIGIERIIAESGIAKATLYQHFGGKEDLIVAYLENRHAHVIEGIRSNLLCSNASLVERVMHVFRLLEHKASSDEEFRGCAFLMAVSEHGSNARIVGVAQRHKAAVREIFLSLLPAPSTGREALADQLSLLY